MRITCWGSRGSFPVSGPNTSRYGGDTTCLEITSDSAQEVLVLDAGTGLRRLGKHLLDCPFRRIHLFLSHLHLDHVCGIGSFSPLFDPSFEVLVYHQGPYPEQAASVFKTLLSPPLSPAKDQDLRAELSFHPLPKQGKDIAGLTVSSLPLIHPGGAAGLRFDSQDNAVAIIPDNELGIASQGQQSDLTSFCRDTDLLIHDAKLLDQEYGQFQGWGHSSAGQAARLALKAQTGYLGLFHHAPDRTDLELDAIEEQTRHWLRSKGLGTKCTALYAGWTWP